MSDTFDHEGDAWDSYEFRDSDDHYGDYGRAPTMCRKCYSIAVRWRVNANGNWQLFNVSREGSAGNRNVPHQCNPTTANDFDDLS